MRAFIAAEIPEEIQNLLSKTQNELLSSTACVKWVEPRNIHLTLRFLGEINEDRTETVCGVIQEALRGVGAFSVSLSGLGAFPERENPRVIWVGINKGAKELRAIAERLKNMPEGCGKSAEERPFSAHITLGRVRSNDNSAALKKLLGDERAAAQLNHGKYVLKAVSLLRSTLTGSGPLYAPLRTFNLTTT
jgi:2'-5' RNA ligase